MMELIFTHQCVNNGATGRVVCCIAPSHKLQQSILHFSQVADSLANRLQLAFGQILGFAAGTSVAQNQQFRHRFETIQHASRVIADWILFYNTQRPHQALGMRTPAEQYQLAA